MINQSLLLLILLPLAIPYDIHLNCKTSGCPPNCKHCQTLSGGPFQAITVCVDGLGGCNKNSTFIISFDCHGCSNGKDCSYTWTQNSYSITGCTNNDDKLWITVKSLLDTLYSAVKQTDAPYNWCANSCGLSTGAIVGIVIGVISGLALLGVGIHFFLKRKRASREGYTKHTSSLIA